MESVELRIVSAKVESPASTPVWASNNQPHRNTLATHPRLIVHHVFRTFSSPPKHTSFSLAVKSNSPTHPGRLRGS